MTLESEKGGEKQLFHESRPAIKMNEAVWDEKTRAKLQHPRHF